MQIVIVVVFLSTLSLRRATRAANCQQRNHQISIHALLAESDKPIEIGPNLIDDFYPRSPCGERPRRTYRKDENREFLSTLSLRRATFKIGENLTDRKHFYPRSPCGERRRNSQNINRGHTISIHALLAESDCKINTRGSEKMKFLSTLSLRRATARTLSII